MKTENASPEASPSGVAAAPEPTHAPGARADAGPEKQSVVANVVDYPELEAIRTATETGSLNHLMDMEVCVTAELGRVTMSIGDILKLGLGSVVELERSVSEPIDLLVQGVPFARGEVVVVEDRFAIRIQEILDPKQAGKK